MPVKVNSTSNYNFTQPNPAIDTTVRQINTFKKHMEIPEFPIFKPFQTHQELRGDSYIQYKMESLFNRKIGTFSHFYVSFCNTCHALCWCNRKSNRCIRARIPNQRPYSTRILETGRWTFGSLAHARECILKNLRELLHRCSKWIRRSEFEEASRATFVHVLQIFEMVRLHVPWVTAIPSITRRNAASIRMASQRHSIFNTAFTRSHRRSFC